MPIRNIRSYSIDCTGDVCQGDEILFTEIVWGGSHRRPVALGERRIAARVDRDSYGAAKQQHTFSLTVLGSDGLDALRRGDKIRRKGRNVYRNGVSRTARDEEGRAADLADKHARGAAARALRAVRRDGAL